MGPDFFDAYMSKARRRHVGGMASRDAMFIEWCAVRRDAGPGGGMPPNTHTVTHAITDGSPVRALTNALVYVECCVDSG